MTLDIIDLIILSSASIAGFFLGYNIIKTVKLSNVKDSNKHLQLDEDFEYNDEEISKDTPEDIKNVLLCGVDFSKISI